MKKLLPTSFIFVLLPFTPHVYKFFACHSDKTERWDNCIGRYTRAKDLIKNLNRMLPLIDTLIKDSILFKYQHADSRKAAQALILKSVKEPKQALELSIGVKITACHKAT